MTMLSNLDLIIRVPLFSSLAVEQAQLVASNVVKRRYKRGEEIVRQGEKTNALYILLTGSARVVSATPNDADKEVILAVLRPADYVGEMSLIDNAPHSATVVADSLTDVLVLASEQFAQCLANNQAMAYSIMRGLVRRLRYADAKIESLALLDVYGRVARVLLEFARKDPRTESMVIQGRVSRRDVAKMVGASREMVSRVMKDLEEKGFIITLPNGDTELKEKIVNLG